MTMTREEVPTTAAIPFDTAAVDKLVSGILKKWRAPGAAIALIDGDAVYVQGYGVREVGRPEPVTPHTLFAIGSTTKAFTSAAMAILVDEGKINWDDHPRKHLPGFSLTDPVADANVTLRDLLCHRTGMPRHDALWYATPWERAEIVRRFGCARARHPFRAVYEYANIPFVAAGLAIASAAGCTWEEFVQARLLDPLGMTETNFSVDTAQAAPDHATPHNQQGKPIPWYNLDQMCPAGGINANVLDLSRWVRLHLGEGEFAGQRLISTANLRETHKPHMVDPVVNPNAFGFNSGIDLASYCLGWEKIAYRGHMLLPHGGAIDGFLTVLTLAPQLKRGLVVLTNTTNGDMMTVLSKSLLDLLLGLPRQDWDGDIRALKKAHAAKAKEGKAEECTARHKHTRPSRELVAYTGDYEDAAYGSLSITLEDGKLSLHYYKLVAKLVHYHYDTFQATFKDPGFQAQLKLIFSLNVKGEVASVKGCEPWFEAEFTRTAQGQ